jgi:hypothetical protein
MGDVPCGGLETRFYELSTGSKITLLMPESLQAQLGSQGLGVSGSFAKSGLA